MMYTDRRKILFEIRNTLFRRRNILRKVMYDNTNRDYENNLRELRRIEIVLEQMRRGTYGICYKTGIIIPTERLMADPFLTLSE